MVEDLKVINYIAQNHSAKASQFSVILQQKFRSSSEEVTSVLIKLQHKRDPSTLFRLREALECVKCLQFIDKEQAFFSHEQTRIK